MEASQFDALFRSLVSHASRRELLAALAGASLSLASREDSGAAKPGKCKPGCGACATCKRGDCKKTDGKKRCKRGKCRPKADGIACGSGKSCQAGTCVCPAGTELCGGRCLVLCVPPQQRDPSSCLCCGAVDAPCASEADCCPELCCQGGTCRIMCFSDRELKSNLASVDPLDMLARVRELPITTWNYTSEDPAIRHIGPMAQDFAAAFGVGADNRRIHPIDGQGVALAAVQGLATELKQLREENAALLARVAALERERGTS
jgi:hypothetical protein